MMSATVTVTMDAALLGRVSGYLWLASVELPHDHHQAPDSAFTCFACAAGELAGALEEAGAIELVGWIHTVGKVDPLPIALKQTARLNAAAPALLTALKAFVDDNQTTEIRRAARTLIAEIESGK